MKIIKALSAILVICSLSSVCYADFDDIKVYVDNQLVEYDTQPVTVNDRLLVPMRATFNALGAEVEWIDAAQTVVATKDSKIIALKIGSPILIVEDVDCGECNTVTLDTVPVIANNRTLVPLRAISETLGYAVEWDSETQSVIIDG